MSNPANVQQIGGQSSVGRLPADRAADPKQPVDGLFVANETFATELDGVPVVVHKDVDRVRAGHPLITNNPQYFDPVELGVTFEVAPAGAVEQATRSPGEQRAAPPAAPPAPATAHKGERSKEELLTRAKELRLGGVTNLTKNELKAVVEAAEARPKA